MSRRDTRFDCIIQMQSLIIFRRGSGTGIFDAFKLSPERLAGPPRVTAG